ncbi:MAG: flippase-like domain-containing protein [Clostridiales bacterium]|nr:flippase-like domain-containing protein [Clostridiales bacterium]MDO4349784.1 lysylphosphatidylglycerol synthase transmembrane domain-containing protein [Eubacteriales bacterium]MDY4008054.1 lysylphosphatidylglycerol synthase transmembrane domain-containing protein [Candidatus Limiplasma sp.]
MARKPNFERLFSILFLLITLGVVLYIGFRGNDLEALGRALRTLSPVYLLLCLISWMLYVLMDALAVHHFLHMQGRPVKLRQSLRAAMTGIYYSNITPGATGGQPMEMYSLSKCGVPIGVSGSAMAVKFIVFQAVLLITGAALWITHAAFVGAHLQGSTWFVLLGYAVNLFSIGMVALMAISRRAVRKVIEWCIRIGVRLRVCKNPEASRAKWENHCQSFLDSVHLVIRHPKDVLIQCLIALGQLMSLMLVILAIYHAFGLSGASMGELITMGVLLYIGASYTPLPGASGAQEGGFAVLFKHIFPDAQLFVALLLWRFSTYYLSILAGALLTMAENVNQLRRRGQKQEGVSNEHSK